MRVPRAFARAPARPRGAGPAQATASVSVGAGIHAAGQRWESAIKRWAARFFAITFGGERGSPQRRSAGMSQSPVVHSHPEIVSGEPVFVGTRVPARNLLEWIEGGHTLD